MGKRYLKAEMWDRMQFFMRNHYDKTSHLIIYYDNLIDEKIISDVYYNIAMISPVLRSTFCYNPIVPYWKITNIEKSDFFKVVNVEKKDLESEIDRFVLTKYDHREKCQFQVRLFRSEGKDAMVSIYNHMCFDGGDFKYFFSKIIEAYNTLKQGKPYKYDFKNGTRSAEQVYYDMDKEYRKKAKRLYNNVSRVPDKIYFPYTKKTKNDVSRVVHTTMSEDVFAKLKNKAKQLNFTINDVIMAAYARAIHSMCNLTEKNIISIPIMVDLRRYIKDGQTKGLTNLTGIMLCKIYGGVGNNILDTLNKVSDSINALKQDKFIGLQGLPLLKLAYTIFPQVISDIALKIGYRSPLLSVTNVGVIKGMDLYGANVENIIFFGGVNYKPYMRLATATINDKIFFSFPFVGNDEDEKIVNKFLDYIKQGIMDFIEIQV